MEVVSSNSDAEIARNDALQGLRWRLRELAANLMRIARGAGQPHGVGEQVYAVLEGYRAYHAAAGYYPGNRSEERRVGKECVSTCRSRGSPYPQKKTTKTIHITKSQS